MIKVVYLGMNSIYSILPLLAIRNLCNIEAVITPASTPGIKDKLKSITGYKSTGPYSISKTCRTYGIKCIETSAINSSESVKIIADLNPDNIFISGFNEILKNEIISIADKGVFNAHSSLLPRYRGAHPFFSMIRNREKKGGCTIHRVTEKFDDGEIIYQDEFDIYEGMNLSTYNTLAGASAARGFRELIFKINDNVNIISRKNEHKGLPVAFNPKANDLILDHNLTVEVFLWMFNALSDSYPLCIKMDGKNKKLLSVSREPLNYHMPFRVLDGLVYLTTS